MTAKQFPATLPQTVMERAVVTLMACRSGDFHGALLRFEHVAALVAPLPPRIDRDAVYWALGVGVMLVDNVDALNPAWLRDRDDAHAQARNAVKRLRRVLARRELDHRVDAIEGDLARLIDCGGREGERDELSPSRGGRPRGLWREHVIALLRTAHVPSDDVPALLQAAGLADTTPKRARKPKRS